ncbi:MAG: RidA family protein [Flavobacteriaceae bacterium]|nr:RidA family protein [Flavobacteriaceae bacterium]
MTKRIITTTNAPAPIGPYNQAVLVNETTLYTSGQIALNPTTMELVLDDILTETKQVMENMKAVLKAAEMTFDNVIKTSIFISDMNNFSKINEVYGTYFDEATAPARETVEVACLPKNVNVEISMIAIK